MTNFSSQTDLFATAQLFPEGLRYAPEMLTRAEESELVAEMAGLPFKEFEFQGSLGKRRVVSFGWRYDFNGGGMTKAEAIPPFLLRAHNIAARASASSIVISCSTSFSRNTSRGRPSAGIVTDHTSMT